ncbi:MAG: type I restriction endonuclease subunit R [Candidatus Woesearchaeota archaeon]
MPKIITESAVEEECLEVLKGMGYSVLYGPDISEGGPREERKYSEVVLVGRLRDALERINKNIPKEAIEEAVKRVLRTESQNLVANNHYFHKLLVNGVPVEYRQKDRSIKQDIAWLFDFENVNNNEFLAVNQFTVIENNNIRRPDIVLFVNGLPLAVIELKNPADEKATWESAFTQFQTYKQEIPSLFQFNEVLVASDGLIARAGTITSNKEWFMPWKTIDGKTIAPKNALQIDIMLKGMFEKQRFLDIIKNFVLFEKHHEKISKKIAGYHQYHAVNKAVEATIKATSAKGDKRCGVVWHTQGSGKSLTMVFYAGKLVLQPELENPTIVVINDRNDLDNQLYDTFSNCSELLRQKPKQANTRTEMRNLLKVASGGIVFTTIQKFLPEVKGDKHPLLSSRRNIVVIADEAHRSQYDFIDGLAKHLRDALPNASFIGFTGTPIEKADRNTPAVFGDYIDTYDIERAVEDGATVSIFYEGRLAKLELKPEEVPKIDPKFEEVTEGEETERKEQLKTAWARLEAVVGTEKRVKLIAKDIVNHFEKRLETLKGKGMIVCMSRRICVDLYNAIIKLRPEWHNKDDEKGFLKVVMTGSASDPVEWQQHIRNKKKREKMADRMKDENDPLTLVIVRDMWLTGFDVPSLHTMYLDKPMRGHGLMQAIARVNRVFKNKPGGLVVDYLGIADQLKLALADYTLGDRKHVGIPQEEAVAVMQEKCEIVQTMFHGFNYSKLLGTPKAILANLPAAMNHILAQKDGKARYLKAVTELSKAFALAVPHEEALKIRDEVGFFQVVRLALAKTESPNGRTLEELDTAIRQIISQAVASEQVVDIFKSAGLKTPDISILSDEFLAEIKGLPHKNLALELLQKLLNDEIKTRAKKNLIQSRSFAEMLEKTIKRYQNRSIETAQVISELINLAKQMRDANKRGESLHLSEEELAFYDALETNDSAVKVLGDKTLRDIARELVKTVKNNVSIDWTLRESIQAQLRVMVKRVLRKYGYPPDKQEKATQTVLEQAKLIGYECAASS